MELKAGDYEIKKNASMAEIMELLTQGRGVLSKVTIPEGLTSLQIVERLRAEDELVGDITEIPPEGSLLPDTYRFSKGMERRELLERMQAEMQRFLAAAWERRQPSLPIATPEEAVIFASIVEKETGRADERGRVAAVFMNRLNKGMRLQSDPTVIYGIVGGQGTLGPLDHARRPRPEDAPQHLSDRRPAADADLQPGTLGDRGVAQSARHQRPLLRRRRHRRAHVLRHLEGAQRGGHQLAQGRARAQERGGRRSCRLAGSHSGSAGCRRCRTARTQRRPGRRRGASATAAVPLPVRKPKQ